MGSRNKSSFYDNLVHVTRCKDCKNFKRTDDVSLCTKTNIEVCDQDYCSLAVQKQVQMENEFERSIKNGI